MRIKKSVRGDGMIELTVTVPPRTVGEVLERAVYNLAAINDIDLLDHTDLTKAVIETVGEPQFKAYTESYVMDFLVPFAISQEQLGIILRPHTEARTPLVEGLDFTFTVLATPKPLFELSSYEPVSITMPKMTFEDYEVDEQLVDMARNYGVKVITDEWIKENIPEVKDIGSLRALLQAEGIKYKESQSENMKTMLAIEQLTERFTGEIPDALFKYTCDDMLRGFEEQLKQQGMTKEDYFNTQGGDEKQLNMNMMLETREVLTQGLSLDAIAAHNGLTVTDADIEQTFEEMAPEHSAEAREQIESTGQMYLIREAALRRKTTKWLVDTARITTAD